MKRIGQMAQEVLKVIPPKAQLNQLPANLGARAEAVRATYPTSMLFAADMNLESCVKRYSMYPTVLDALQSRKVKLRELSSIYSESEVVGWIEMWLIVLSKHMDFKISDSQSELTAITILEECYMFNIAEFTLMFKKIIKGDYGIFYGKFNMQTIIIACKGYRKERGRSLVKLSSEEQDRLMLERT